MLYGDNGPRVSASQSLAGGAGIPWKTLHWHLGGWEWGACVWGVPHGKAGQGSPGPRSRERRPSERAKLGQGQGRALKAASVGVNLS